MAEKATTRASRAVLSMGITYFSALAPSTSWRRTALGIASAALNSRGLRMLASFASPLERSLMRLAASSPSSSLYTLSKCMVVLSTFSPDALSANHARYSPRCLSLGCPVFPSAQAHFNQRSMAPSNVFLVDLAA